MKVHHFVNSRYLHMINSDTVKMKEVAQQADLWDFSWYWWITALGIKIYPIMVSLVRSTENYYFNLSLRWCEAKPFKLMSETFEKVSGGYRGEGSNEYITSNCRPGKNVYLSVILFMFWFFFSFFYLIPDFMVIEFIEKLCFQFKELGNTVPGLLKVKVKTFHLSSRRFLHRHSLWRVNGD